jgi:PAS domain S-box-containing protein
MSKDKVHVSQKLIDFEEKFRAVFDQTYQLRGLLSPDGILLEANKTALNFGNYQPSDVVGKYFWETPWWEHDKEIVQKLRAAIKRSATGESVRFEMSLPEPDGTPHWMDFSLKPFYDKNNKISMLIAEGWEITERKIAEQTIIDIAKGMSSQSGRVFFENVVKQIAGLFDAKVVFIGLINEADTKIIDTILIYSNNKFVDNISYPILHTPCSNVVGKEICNYQSNVQTLFPRDAMLVEIGAESYLGAPLFNSKGEGIGLIAAVNDKPMQLNELSEQVLKIFSKRTSIEVEKIQSDEKLRDMQQKLTLHFQQTPLGVIEWNKNFEVVAWNPAAENIFGYSHDEAIGKRAVDLLIPAEVIPQVDIIWQELLKNKGGMRSTNKNITQNGHTITCEWYNTPLVNEFNEVIGVASLVVDISENIQSKNELIMHRDHLEEMVEQRTEELESFSYSISHDLRAPLRSIMGFTEIIKEDYSENLGDDGNKILSRIINSTQRMTELINDLLVLSRLGRKKLNKEEIDFDNLTTDIIQSFKENLTERKITFKCNSLGMIWADRGLLKIVMENLISNACKYTSKNKESCVEIGKETSNNETVFYIKDNGVGFDMKQVSKIFTVFSRLHSVNEFEGTGIGLATVQKIIHRHSGRIWADSIINKETVFCFTLPT